MKNIAIMNLLVEGYESIAYTDNYIYGFRFNGAIYMVNMRGLDSRVLKLDRASRGLDMRFASSQQQILSCICFRWAQQFSALLLYSIAL